ncbi:MAG: 4-(cytidine 5'-diphospho)-2-C-methyl-D-erythritol kinase, partial [Lentisphaeria bacterium]|nr:4-(cytidine 5'-diphospho)-2-C-methyl-D-erythritol kinase [Lentisphaeria bacterium]
SADAAAALRLLEERCGALGRRRLYELAGQLGADVPLFIEPRPAAARGVGDELEFLPGRLPHLPLVLVNPGFPVRTEWAFRKLDETGRGENRAALPDLLAALERGDLERIARNVGNDFGALLMRKFPLLSLLREELRGLGALAVEVSGSGPTLFGLFADRAAAGRAAAELSIRRPQCFVAEAEDGL